MTRLGRPEPNEVPTTAAIVPSTLAGSGTYQSDVANPPPAPPVPDEDRHPGNRPPSLLTARDARPDNLQLIKGIGPQNEQRLHGLGVWHFDQIGAWTEDEIKWVGSYLAFPGRIDREAWVAQAKAFATGAVDPTMMARRTSRPT